MWVQNTESPTTEHTEQGEAPSPRPVSQAGRKRAITELWAAAEHVRKGMPVLI